MKIIRISILFLLTISLLLLTLQTAVAGHQGASLYQPGFNLQQETGVPPLQETAAETPVATEEPTLEPTTETPPTATTESPTITIEPPTATTQPPTATTQPPTQTTQAPTATATLPLPSSDRPLVVLESYKTSPGNVKPGSTFELIIKLINQGRVDASNLMITFTPGEFLALKSGGVLAVGDLSVGNTRRMEQTFAANSSLAGKGVATMEAKISYTGADGASYSEVFILALNLAQPEYSGSSAPKPTATATPIARPQLVISGYQSDVDTLKPGTQFNLQLQVVNAGNATARRVTMIAGGGSVTPGNGDPNTPTNGNNPPNINASGGEFTNFSPLGVSNVQFLGDIPAGEGMSASQPLIVNVTTNPGAYSFKISFAYNDEKGNLLIDDQVISLLVFSPPVVEINFYIPPAPLMVGMPGQLPLQIVNLGRKSAVLGNMRVTAQDTQMINNVVLIGTLEAGGYFTLDASAIPNAPGPLELTVTVDYTDDFNQPQIITRTLTVEVQDAPPIDPGMGPGGEPGVDPGMGFPPEPQPETTWQKFLRFLRGLIGLDSGQPAQGPEGMPPMEGPPSGESGPFMPPVQ